MPQRSTDINSFDQSKRRPLLLNSCKAAAAAWCPAFFFGAEVFQKYCFAGIHQPGKKLCPAPAEFIWFMRTVKRGRSGPSTFPVFIRPLATYFFAAFYACLIPLFSSDYRQQLNWSSLYAFTADIHTNFSIMAAKRLIKRNCLAEDVAEVAAVEMLEPQNAVYSVTNESRARYAYRRCRIARCTKIARRYYCKRAGLPQMLCSSGCERYGGYKIAAFSGICACSQ